MLKVILAALLLLILVSIILYIMTIQIKLKIMRKNEDDIVLIIVKTLYGIINVKFEIPLLDIVFSNERLALKYEAELKSNKTDKLLKYLDKIFTIEDFKNIRQYFSHDPVLLNKIKAYCFDRFIIKDFSIILKYGLTDAALAAWIYGLICTILGSLIAVMKRKINLSIKDVVITPYFDCETFSIEFSCIIKFKFGDIINIGIMVLRRRKQRNKVKQQLNSSLNQS